MTTFSDRRRSAGVDVVYVHFVASSEDSHMQVQGREGLGRGSGKAFKKSTGLGEAIKMVWQVSQGVILSSDHGYEEL